MKDFRRPSGQGAGRGGFDKRAAYGTHKGDHNPGERREIKHQAVCSECSKTCEVPFRPNGSKPVYCKDCFGSKKGAQGSVAPRPAPLARNTRVDELKSQMDLMQSKLDRILEALEAGKAEDKPAPAKKAVAKKKK